MNIRLNKWIPVVVSPGYHGKVRISRMVNEGGAKGTAPPPLYVARAALTCGGGYDESAFDRFGYTAEEAWRNAADELDSRLKPLSPARTSPLPK